MLLSVDDSPQYSEHLNTVNRQTGGANFAPPVE
jgi:hypothetical protein